MLSLNGKWKIGLERNYTEESDVPGLVYSACEPTKGALWYKKEINLPKGEWSRATLILYGARYMPKVYINGSCVSSAEGGLTITRHLLASEDVKPGNTVILEIELSSFDKTPDTDASKIPEADVWRSDLSSHIWNDAYIDFHDDIRIDSIVTDYVDNADVLEISYKVTAFTDLLKEKIEFFLCDGEKKLFNAKCNVESNGKYRLPLHGECKTWSPENPVLYTLKVKVKGSENNQKIGIKTLKEENLGFKLNNVPITLRMGSVCWHRWQRDPQAKEIAYDENWFLNNILLPLKANGANTIRFHLGPPPEKFIDLCDTYGMLVQMEWSFFHDLEASPESLREQWTNWLDMSLRHVSIAVIHPWNEIFECQKLADARATLNEIVKNYPPFILSHRDVMHVHHYWWSMFENVGVYYDNKEQFDMAMIVDEFGGNYLDYEYNPGLYPELKPAFLRFLGENHTADDRKWLQKVSHSKIAEYWRRTGIAGFSPFCMLSSPEDGNTYFEGNLKDGKFKPVFSELKAAYMPVSVSMDIWDRNFYPEQQVKVNLHLFNDTPNEKSVTCIYGIDEMCPSGELKETLAANSKKVVEVEYKVPSNSGEYTMYARIDDAVSKWDIIVTELDVSEINRTVGICSIETELEDFFKKNRIPYTYDLSEADIIVGLEKTYNLFKINGNMKKIVEDALTRGASVALLSAGPKLWGMGYESDSLSRLQKVRRVDVSELESVEIAFGISAKFRGANEPESCVHPTGNMEKFWININKRGMWLWNGLRGGLIVPAADMAVVGNDKESFEKLWASKGADVSAMKKSDYFSYELEGYYEYSSVQNSDIRKKLRDKVRFFVEDAPSLKDSINPEAEIIETNLYKDYYNLDSSQGKIRYIDIAKAGKRLLRTPASVVELKNKKGKLFISQMMFDGRLCGKEKGFYELRNDASAAQLLINIIRYL